VPFFEHLAALRRQEPALKFGGVTNGLALHLYADDLSRIRLDFLDISIDGLSPEHDAMRGTGTFQRTIANLRLALDGQVAERVIISPTLTRGNADSLLELIPYLILDLGVQWVDIGPLMAVKLQEFQLRETDLVHFLTRLTRTLKGLNVSHPITVLVEICAYCAAFIPALIDLGWLIPEELRQDRYGHLYQDIHINNMITITLRPELIPEYWRHTVRITADGFMVGGCEPLTQREYHRFAVGNIKEEPLKMLYRKALAPGSPFYHMMLAFDRSECRQKACFAHCLGGDALLAHVAYGDYHRRDPNCIRDENRYRKQGVFHAA
jgi:MoaA/NifB/PqqE/SkfB family radical SAM enzyme